MSNAGDHDDGGEPRHDQPTDSPPDAPDGDYGESEGPPGEVSQKPPDEPIPGDDD